MMRNALAPLLADGVIDEVVGRLKSGKEAELWIVRHHGEIVAAKVYKQREVRSFHNNAAYTEGRRVRNTRTQRAMARGSRFGRAADEEAWKAREADALHTLHAGGVRVPRPLMFYEGVLIMELVVDEAGHPAPRLIDARVDRTAAAPLYFDLRRQVIAMLCCDLVHGDLSPYNVLLGRAGPVIIDFPQSLGAAHNNQAEKFLRRDLENLRRFFVQNDPELRKAVGDAQEIWRAYARRELTPDFIPVQRAVETAPPFRPAPAHERPSAATQRALRPPPALRGTARDRPSQARSGRDVSADSRAHAPARPDRRYPEVVRVVRGTAPLPVTVPPGPRHLPATPPVQAAPSNAPAPQRGQRRRRWRGRGRHRGSS
jgi:RIO kinase 1